MLMRNVLTKRPLRTATIALSSAAAAALLVGMGPATSGAVQPSAASGQHQWTGYGDLVETIMPAVVTVTSTRSAKPAFIDDRRPFRGQGPNQGMPGGEWFERFFEKMPRGFRGMPDMPGPGPQFGAGSGFIIDSDGLIVTNHHVIADAETITVSLADGTELSAEIVGQDPETDLALLRVDADRELPSVAFADSDQVRVGDPVVAIGNPFGLGGTVTAGIVSAKSRDIGAGRFDDFLQIDAPINRGNSGGPAFDLEGKVVGINTLITSPSGGNIGIGFAIPANLAERVIDDLRDDGKVDRGWLGVQIQTLDEDLAEALSVENAEGALVSEVMPDSPAEAAGLAQQDVITKVDDEAVEGVRDLVRTISEIEPGAETELTVWRDGETVELEVTIAETAADDEAVLAKADGGTAEQDAPRIGVALAKLNDELRRSLNLAKDVDGIVVTDVEPGSAAAAKGPGAVT